MSRAGPVSATVLIAMGTVFALTGRASAETLGEAIRAAAGRLVANQTSTGPLAGSWPAEADYTGTIVAGMADAFAAVGVAGYKTSAVNGGNYILYSAGGNFYGDEAYALTRLSDLSANRASNGWRSAVSTFYEDVRQSLGGTSNYIEAFSGTEASNATFYLAQHTVAAYYVGAAEKTLWRSGLVDFLATVDTNAHYPVWGLGASVWALTQTGPMDSTPVDADAPPTSPWYGKTLADLPGMLRSHQVSGGTYGGSFYWRFDHTNGGDPASQTSGYTDDANLGVLGMAADNKAHPSPLYAPALYAASEALLQGVDSSGVVREHLWLDGEDYYAYAGETIQALLRSARPGDANLDGHVNSADAVTWQVHYDPVNAVHQWYEGDWNFDGLVNSADAVLWQVNYFAPEPATLALVGLGGALVAASRRKA